MFAVAFLFLTVHTDFWLPDQQFDRKWCWDRERAGVEDRRCIWRHLMLWGRVRPTPPTPDCSPSFVFAVMFLTAHPDFYLSNEQFDRKYDLGPPQLAPDYSRASWRGAMLRGHIRIPPPLPVPERPIPFAVPLLLLTVNPDFYLADPEFDKKHCRAYYDFLGGAISGYMSQAREVASIPPAEQHTGSAQSSREQLADCQKNIDNRTALLARKRAAERSNLLRAAVGLPPVPFKEEPR